jgi:hypothetical protein
VPEKDKPTANTRLAVERFRTYRRLSRVFVGFGLVVSLARLFIAGDEFHFSTSSASEFIWSGLGLMGLGAIVAGLILHVFFCRKCPACKKAFTLSPKYPSDEGLPVYNKIELCPFCGIKLEERK